MASQKNKKLGTFVREAVEEYHLKKGKQRRIAKAADQLLSLSEVPAPENYKEWEKEYLEKKFPPP
ncbi:MAG: hypothetical protein JRJ85_08345 [Deltaproteobacteria bacterium]|nr:hypothetical protein [Deltaproteobacteria bacterium]